MVVQIEATHIVATAKGAAFTEVVIAIVGVALADQAANHEQV